MIIQGQEFLSKDDADGNEVLPIIDLADIETLVAGVQVIARSLVAVIDGKDIDQKKLLAKIGGASGAAAQFKKASESVGAALQTLAAKVADTMVENEEQRTTILGQTIYLAPGMSVKVRDEYKGLMRQIAEEAGIDDMLSVNAQTLAAWVKKQQRFDDLAADEDGNLVVQFDLHPKLKEALVISEFITARVRKG